MWSQPEARWAPENICDFCFKKIAIKATNFPHLIHYYYQQSWGCYSVPACDPKHAFLRKTHFFQPKNHPPKNPTELPRLVAWKAWKFSQITKFQSPFGGTTLRLWPVRRNVFFWGGHAYYLGYVHARKPQRVYTCIYTMKRRSLHPCVKSLQPRLTIIQFKFKFTGWNPACGVAMVAMRCFYCAKTAATQDA